MFVLKCGHIALDWPAVRALGTMVDSVYCETCVDWIPLRRKATAYEIVGLDPAVIPDDCPY